jgi:hypothetical protein
MAKGFWSVIKDLGPQLPEGADVEWSASDDTLLEVLRASGVEVTKHAMEVALSAAPLPGTHWPWRVEKVGSRYRFKAGT